MYYKITNFDSIKNKYISSSFSDYLDYMEIIKSKDNYFYIMDSAEGTALGGIDEILELNATNNKISCIVKIHLASYTGLDSESALERKYEFELVKEDGDWKISKFSLIDDKTFNNNQDTKSEPWIGDITKIDLSNLHKEGIQYEGLKPLGSKIDRYFQMKTVDGKVSIAMKKIDGEILGTDSSDSLGYTNYNSYDGFSDWIELSGISDVKTAYAGAFGQDFWGESYILFLMNDGTIKYDSFKNVVRNQVVLKNIPGLNNVVELYECGIAGVENGQRLGGAATTIAVDEHGVAYDVGDFLN